MDEPICYDAGGHPELDGDRLSKAIYEDDKDEFFRPIGPIHKDDTSIRCFFPSVIFENDAVKIATALFDGETRDNTRFYNWPDEMTPQLLQDFAVEYCAPGLTKHFLEKGIPVIESSDPNESSTFELATQKIYEVYELDFDEWDPEEPLFFLLWWLCCQCRRYYLEVLRLVVQYTRNKEHIRKVIADYADKGDMVQLAALFLAVPELFLSSDFVSLGGGLSPSVKTRHIQQSLALLFHIFAAVGDKLVTYIRLEGSDGRCPQQTALEIDFLLREIARKKQGVSSDDDIRCIPTSLQLEDEDRLNQAIEKKLSSMSTLQSRLEAFAKISNKLEVSPSKLSKKWEVTIPHWFPLARQGRMVELDIDSFGKFEASAKLRFDFKISPNKVMKPTKLKPPLSVEAFNIQKFANNIRIIAKRFLK